MNASLLHARCEKVLYGVCSLQRQLTHKAFFDLVTCFLHC